MLVTCSMGETGKYVRRESPSRVGYCHTNFSWKLFKIFSLVKAETIRTLDFQKYSSDYHVMLGCQVSIHRFSHSQSKIIYGLSRLS